MDDTKYMLDYEAIAGGENPQEKEVLEPVVEDAEKRLFTYIMGYIFM